MCFNLEVVIAALRLAFVRISNALLSNMYMIESSNPQTVLTIIITLLFDIFLNFNSLISARTILKFGLRKGLMDNRGARCFPHFVLPIVLVQESGRLYQSQENRFDQHTTFNIGNLFFNCFISLQEIIILKSVGYVGIGADYVSWPSAEFLL